MDVVGDWKDEYAESLKRDLGTVYHHVHPRVPGAAHCDRRVRLAMNYVRSAPPTDCYYCERCQRIAERNLFLRENSNDVVRPD